MDERTAEMSADYTQRAVQRKIEESKRTREFTVIAIGHENDQPFSFEADTRGDCCDKLVDRGIDLVSDRWAAGHIILSSGAPMVFGKDPMLEQQLEDYLRNKR